MNAYWSLVDNVGICVCWLHPPKNRHYCLPPQHVGNILFCRPSCPLSALCWRDLSLPHSLTCMRESVLASEGGNKNVELIGCSIHARQAHGFVLSFFINLLSNSYHCHDSLCCLHHRPNRTSCQHHHCCPSHLLPSPPSLLPLGLYGPVNEGKQIVSWSIKFSLTSNVLASLPLLIFTCVSSRLSHHLQYLLYLNTQHCLLSQTLVAVAWLESCPSYLCKLKYSELLENFKCFVKGH